MTEFQKIKSLVLSTLGLQSFATEKDKVVFTEDQKTAIRKEYALFGEGFVEKFSEALNNEIANTSAQDQAQALKTMLDSVRAESAKQISEMKLELQSAKADITKLSKAPEVDETIPQPIEGGKKVPFEINKAHAHNKWVKAKMKAKDGEVVMAGTTIDIDDLKSEFGTYLSQTDRPIIETLTQPTESEKFMTTKVAIEIWRASKAEISSVVQQFVSKWTPLGQGKFTPIEIQNRRHKINVPITPDEINLSWLSFLYDEKLTPEQMPITKYMIERLVLPKAAEDRELRLIGTGVYSTTGLNDADGEAGQPTGRSMDGYITILKKMYEAKLTTFANVNFINFSGVPVTSANIQDKMEEFVDSIDEIYQSMPMNIFVSKTLYRQYKRRYREEYPLTKNSDGGNDEIDFSVQRLQSLPSMASCKHFFATPKENFIRLRNLNDGANRIFLQTANYDVKVFAEWWEAVGFAIQEALFVYIDALSLINEYRAADDASKLTTYMLEDAGCTAVSSAELAGYKAAVAAATVDYTAATLQTMVTTVNAA